MFERYLKKPSTTSVGFLVLDKLNNSSQGRLSRGPKAKNDNYARGYGSRGDSCNKQYEMISGGGGIISDAGKSPLQSSKNDFKDNIDGESFGLSVLQTTFEVENSQQEIVLRKKNKFDTFSTD